MSLRWGVAGGGRVSHDFITAIRTYPNAKHEFVAVADIWKDTAKKFATDHEVPKYYGSYEELANDKDVDIVYVANINPQHYATTKIMLEHGKHVLCEKPITMNERQTKLLYQLAKEKKVFLMEGLWSRCSPVYMELRRIIDSGEIGDVLFVGVNFGQAIQHVERLVSKDLGGGAIFDLGCYMLQFPQYVFRGLKPLKISATGHLNSHGTDESCGAIITYPNGKMAAVSTSARIDLPNEGVIIGTKGTLTLPDFWCPTKIVTPSGVKEWPQPEPPAPFFHHNSGGFWYEAEVVKQCITEGKIECPYLTHEESIEISRQMDFLRKAVGVEFPEDSQEF